MVTGEVAIVGQFVSVAFVFSVLLASASLLLPVELRVNYHREHQDDHFYVEIRALRGLIYHKFVIPVWEFRIDQVVPSLRLKTYTLEHPAEHANSRQQEHWITSVEHLREKWVRLRQRWAQYRPVLGLVLKHTECTCFSWKTQFGLGDAALTGITTGIIWMIKSFMIGMLRHHTRFDTTPQVAVRPIFTKSTLHTSFDCIFKLHLGDIMVVRLLLAKKEPS